MKYSIDKRILALETEVEGFKSATLTQYGRDILKDTEALMESYKQL